MHTWWLLITKTKQKNEWKGKTQSSHSFRNDFLEGLFWCEILRDLVQEVAFVVEMRILRQILTPRLGVATAFENSWLACFRHN